MIFKQVKLGFTRACRGKKELIKNLVKKMAKKLFGIK